MSILVTGAGGFIGSYVVNELIARNLDVIAFDRHSHYDQIDSVMGDICDREELANAIHSFDVKGIINLAGMLGTEEIFGAEAKAVEINILGALNIFDLAAEKDIPVVQIGTGHKGQPNPYAITKGAAEDIALARSKYFHNKIAVVRAFHVYGPGQKVCPPHGKSSVRKIIPSFVCRALTGMDIEIYGRGNQIIDLVHVADVARVLVDALNGPYDVVTKAGTGIGTPVYDAAIKIVKLTNSQSKIVFLPMRVGEPWNSRVVADKPTCWHTWPYRLEETIDWYRSYLEG